MYTVIDPIVEADVAGLSLRDANKRRTSSLLRKTALRMFLKRGYDATKAEDIADRAGVSVRTFYRYFATKDEVVLQGQPAWAGHVVASYRRQPATLPAIYAICEAMIDAAEQMDRKSVAAYGKIVEGSQILRGKAVELLAVSMEEIARAVAAREGLAEASPQARMMAQVAIVVYQAAVRDWRDDRSAGQLNAIIRERFRMLVGLLSEADLADTSPREAARAS